jgi:hypothetical protein
MQNIRSWGPMLGILGWPTCRKRLIILAGVKAPLDLSLPTALMYRYSCRLRCRPPCAEFFQTFLTERLYHYRGVPESWIMSRYASFPKDRAEILIPENSLASAEY